MRALRWTERAVADLEGIAEFVSRTSAVYAEGVILRIERRLQLVRDHPGLGKPATETDDPTVRELVVAPHRVFYRERDETIEVLAIVHGRQMSPEDL